MSTTAAASPVGDRNQRPKTKESAETKPAKDTPEIVKYHEEDLVRGRLHAANTIHPEQKSKTATATAPTKNIKNKSILSHISRYRNRAKIYLVENFSSIG